MVLNGDKRSTTRALVLWGGTYALLQYLAARAEFGAPFFMVSVLLCIFVGPGTGLGEACGSDAECSNGRCDDVAGARLCVRGLAF